MKLAQLLIRRKGLNDRISQLTQRLSSSATVQEGDTPSENIEELIQILFKVIEEFRSIDTTIAFANTSVMVDLKQVPLNEKEDVKNIKTSLKELIIMRDTVKRIHGVLESLATNLNPSSREGGGFFRHQATDIKWVSAYDYKKVRTMADDYAKRFRELDEIIQQTNWNTEIGEKVSPEIKIENKTEVPASDFSELP